MESQQHLAASSPAPSNDWPEQRLAVSRHNLPVLPTGFVGRKEELVALRNLLLQERLVTVVGPGGVGKTRLALQVAARSLVHFRDGVFMVLLEAVDSPDLLVTAIAETLRLPPYRGEGLRSQLLSFLGPKEILLVLDNMEQLVSAAGLLTEIVQQAPRVKILATSRERLDLQGERVLEIAGLRLPEGETTQALSASEAVQLFLQSAQRVCPDFVLTEANCAAVTQICRLVGGLPLALELAGTWVRVLRCEEIAQEIEKDADFLSTDRADVPQRLRSLRAVFERSWGLLEEQEEQVLPRLAIFAGSFQREAAQRVAGATLPVLSALVDKSLLHWNVRHGRYEIHPMIKRYASERLAQIPADQAQAQEQHCTYFLDFLQQREHTIHGSTQLQVLREIGAEMDNVRAAWQWAVGQRRLEQVEASLECLFHFYEARGRFAEGQETLARAAEELSRQGPQMERAGRLAWKMHTRRGSFLLRLNRINESWERLQASLAAWRTIGDDGEASLSLAGLASVAVFRNQYDDAGRMAEEALARARASGLRSREANAQLRLGSVDLGRGDYTAAEEHFQQALQIYQELGDRRGEGAALQSVGNTADEQGRYEQAKTYFQHALLIFRELGNLYWEAVTLDNLGGTYHAQGRFAESRTCREQALAIVRQIGDRQGECRLINNIGNMMTSYGDLEQARQYFGQSLLLDQQSGRRPSGRSISLANLATLAHWMGDNESARDYAERALQIVREIGHSPIAGYILTTLGHALAGLGRLDEAATAYQEALDLRKEMDLPHLAMDSLAGLAGVALARGDLVQARAQAEQIYEFLQHNPLEGMEDPFRTAMACYQVLRAGQDPRAPTFLRSAHRWLQERAARIEDEELRRSFLQNVPSNRALVQAFAELAPGPEAPAVELEEPLTRQELAILGLLAAGLTNQEIADRLTVSIGTVKFHVHNIHGKLGVQNRTQAVARARELGLL